MLPSGETLASLFFRGIDHFALFAVDSFTMADCISGTFGPPVAESLTQLPFRGGFAFRYFLTEPAHDFALLVRHVFEWYCSLLGSSGARFFL